MVPLKYKLRSGDTVEIVTSQTQKPSKDWLKLVKSSRAISKIRAFVKGEERERSKIMGRDLLDREFRRYGQSLPKFEKSKDLQERVGALSFAAFDEMLIAVGYGRMPAEKVVQKLFPDLAPVESNEPEKKKTFFDEILNTAKAQFRTTGRSVVRIQGMDDMLVRFGRCCNPLPGDEICGFISRGRGVTVHKLACPRVLDLNKERQVEVSWASDSERILRDVKIRVVVTDEPGLLNQMSSVISAQGVNIKSLNIRAGADKKAVGNFDLQIKNSQQLVVCIKQLESIQGVISVERVNP
jgi:GTP pyrophosphokinase